MADLAKIKKGWVMIQLMSSTRVYFFPLSWVATIICCMHIVHAEPLFVSKAIPIISSDFTVPPIDPFLGERLDPKEGSIAIEIAKESELKMRRERLLGVDRSSLQHNQCGCIKAHFIINNSLAKNLAQGVFIPGKKYEAWIRFSASENDPTHGNQTLEVQKMVIKLLNVPGKKLIDDDTSSQDFVLVNNSKYFINDPRRYFRFMNDTNGVLLKRNVIPYALGMNGSLTSVDSLASNITNPLQVRYLSVVPYQLGLGQDRQAVKYSVKSCTSEIEKLRIKLTSDYLHEAINSALQQKESCLQFLVQPRTTIKMDVEDTSNKWEESEAPFYPVATLLIPAQDIEKPEQNRACEKLTFTVWHSLPAHRPLGMTNRLRKLIYEHMRRVKQEI